MPSDHQQISVKTIVLKVNVNCHGCRKKVMKILKKIEGGDIVLTSDNNATRFWNSGVFAVNVDAEHQRVMVKGVADAATLIDKLMKSGKHAELWSSKSQQQDPNQQQQNQVRGKNKKQQQNSSGGAPSTDQLVYPNVLGDGQFEGELGQAMDAEEMQNLLMSLSGNRFAGEGENELARMIHMMRLNEAQNNQQGYNYGAAVGPGRNNFQLYQNYPAETAAAAYGYQQPSPVMMANMLGNQYNQNPYAVWLRANPQSMQAMLNNRMLDGQLTMQHQF